LPNLHDEFDDEGVEEQADRQCKRAEQRIDAERFGAGPVPPDPVEDVKQRTDEANGLPKGHQGAKTVGEAIKHFVD